MDNELSIEQQVDMLFETSDAKCFAIWNQMVEDIRVERERPELDNWLRKVDEVLVEEESVLEGLKMALSAGNITQDELDERMKAFHDGMVSGESGGC